jgi:iron(III) transport system substrate-binding protein
VRRVSRDCKDAVETSSGVASQRPRGPAEAVTLGQWQGVVVAAPLHGCGLTMYSRGQQWNRDQRRCGSPHGQVAADVWLRQGKDRSMTRTVAASRRDILKGGAAVIGLAAGAALAPRNARAADMTAHESDLYESAKKEGELTWYTAQSDDVTAQELGRKFEQIYPGIRVNVVRTTAQVAFERVSQEIKAGAMQVDVFSSTDIGHDVFLKSKGQFEHYVPDNAARVLDVYKGYDQDGFYYVTSAGMIGMACNTSKAKLADAPTNWPGLLDSKWKGEIAVGHPGFSGYVGTWAVMLRKLYGWDFFDKLAANNPRVGRSINDTTTLLNSGECIIAGTAANNTIVPSAQKGNPLAMIYPTDGTVLILAPSGIMKGAKHQAAARLYMEFLLSVPASQIWVDHFNESMRPEVSPPAGVKSVKDVKSIRPSVEEISKGVPEVIKQWRDTFGV